MVKSLMLIIISVLLAANGQILMKKGMLEVGRIGAEHANLLISVSLKILTNPFILSGFISFAVSSVIWLVVLSRVPLSFAYPMVSLGYIFVLIMSMIIFKENINIVRWVGVLLICSGIIFIARS